MIRMGRIQAGAALLLASACSPSSPSAAVSAPIAATAPPAPTMTARALNSMNPITCFLRMRAAIPSKDKETTEGVRMLLMQIRRSPGPARVLFGEESGYFGPVGGISYTEEAQTIPIQKMSFLIADDGTTTIEGQSRDEWTRTLEGDVASVVRPILSLTDAIPEGPVTLGPLSPKVAEHFAKQYFAIRAGDVQFGEGRASVLSLSDRDGGVARVEFSIPVVFPRAGSRIDPTTVLGEALVHLDGLMPLTIATHTELRARLDNEPEHQSFQSLHMRCQQSPAEASK
jgi:hypothetical protein